MNKRPDNIALFSFMTAGVYLGYMILGDHYTAFLLIPPAVMFIFTKTRLFASVLFCGTLIFLIHNYNYAANRSISEILDSKDITVSAEIVSNREYDISSGMILETDTVFVGEKPYPVKIRVSSIVPVRGMLKADRIKITGRFRKYLPPTNEHEKDMTKYAFVNNLHGEIVSPKVRSFEKKETFWRRMSDWQDAVISLYERRLSYSAGNFMTAITIGKMDQLESSVIRQYSDSGTIHLLSVSGLHVGFLIVILALISRLLNLKGAVLIFINSAVLLWYAAFTGLSAPVIRAVIMAIIIMLSHPLKRKLRFSDVIGTAGILSLIYDPNQIFSIGFILSFSAVAAIALIYEPMSRTVKEYFNPGNTYFKKITDSVVLSVAVTIGLMPLVLYIFGKYSILSILANVILIPLTGAVFLGGILLLFIDKIDILALFLSDMINLGSEITSSVVKYTAEAEIFTLYYKPDILTVCALLGSIVMIFYISKNKYKLLLSVTITAFISYQIFSYENHPSIYVFNTASGGTAVIESGGESILIAGKLSGTEIKRIVNPYILEKKITGLDFVAVTDEWFDAEKTLKRLDVPVKNVVSGFDMSHMSGEFEKLDLKNINRIIKFPGGAVYFANDKIYRIITSKLIIRSEGISAENRGSGYKF